MSAAKTKYTFEQLKNLSVSELHQIKQEKLEQLYEQQQSEWTLIASILFYQGEIHEADPLDDFSKPTT